MTNIPPLTTTKKSTFIFTNGIGQRLLQWDPMANQRPPKNPEFFTTLIRLPGNLLGYTIRQWGEAYPYLKELELMDLPGKLDLRGFPKLQRLHFLNGVKEFAVLLPSECTRIHMEKQLCVPKGLQGDSFLFTDYLTDTFTSLPVQNSQSLLVSTTSTLYLTMPSISQILGTSPTFAVGIVCPVLLELEHRVPKLHRVVQSHLQFHPELQYLLLHSVHASWYFLLRLQNGKCALPRRLQCLWLVCEPYGVTEMDFEVYREHLHHFFQLLWKNPPKMLTIAIRPSQVSQVKDFLDQILTHFTNVVLVPLDPQGFSHEQLQKFYGQTLPKSEHDHFQSSHLRVYYQPAAPDLFVYHQRVPDC